MPVFGGAFVVHSFPAGSSSDGEKLAPAFLGVMVVPPNPTLIS